MASLVKLKKQYRVLTVIHGLCPGAAVLFKLHLPHISPTTYHISGHPGSENRPHVRNLLVINAYLGEATSISRGLELPRLRPLHFEAITSCHNNLNTNLAPYDTTGRYIDLRFLALLFAQITSLTLSRLLIPEGIFILSWNWCHMYKSSVHISWIRTPRIRTDHTFLTFRNKWPDNRKLLQNLTVEVANVSTEYHSGTAWVERNISSRKFQLTWILENAVYQMDGQW